MNKIVFLIVGFISSIGLAAPSDWLSCQPHGDSIGPVAIELQPLDSVKTEVVMTIVGEKAEVPSLAPSATNAANKKLDTVFTPPVPSEQEVDNQDVPKKLQDQVGTLAQIDGASESAESESTEPMAATPTASAPTTVSNPPVVGSSSDANAVATMSEEKGQLTAEVNTKDLKSMTKFGRFQFVMRRFGSVEFDGALTQAALLDLSKKAMTGKGKTKKTLVSGVLAYRGAVYPLDCKLENN